MCIRDRDKPKSPDLASLLGSYYAYRKSKAYSQKGKLNNLKEMNETFNYLREDVYKRQYLHCQSLSRAGMILLVNLTKLSWNKSSIGNRI